jgi:hypothetical protein
MEENTIPVAERAFVEGACTPSASLETLGSVPIVTLEVVTHPTKLWDFNLHAGSILFRGIRRFFHRIKRRMSNSTPGHQTLVLKGHIVSWVCIISKRAI